VSTPEDLPEGWHVGGYIDLSDPKNPVYTPIDPEDATDEDVSYAYGLRVFYSPTGNPENATWVTVWGPITDLDMLGDLLETEYADYIA
jgi:hypothetical protein